MLKFNSTWSIISGNEGEDNDKIFKNPVMLPSPNYTNIRKGIDKDMKLPIA